MTAGVVVNGECNGAQLNGNATSATTNGGNKHGKKPLAAFLNVNVMFLPLSGTTSRILCRHFHNSN